MLVTYQLGCYEEADQEQFYDLITYFIQDGKNFILKTVKSEAKRFVRAELNAIVICIGLLGYVYTNNIIFVVITIAFFIISLLLSYSNDELEINEQIKSYTPDFLKIVNFYKDKENINPHAVNPEYLKLTEAEESKL